MKKRRILRVNRSWVKVDRHELSTASVPNARPDNAISEVTQPNGDGILVTISAAPKAKESSGSVSRNAFSGVPG